MKAEILRKNRLNLILSLVSRVAQEGRKIDREKLISEFSIEYGISRRTMLEYLNILSKAERIKIESGIILPGKQQTQILLNTE